jgi:hypothetical protein
MTAGGRWFDYDGNPITIEEWDRLFRDFERRQVARTELGDVSVSTVWLGLDHRMPPPLSKPGPPLIFETMIFGGGDDLDEHCWRWPNQHAALAGHDQAVALVRDAVQRMATGER